MGALLEPAVLFRETLNLEATGDRRSERLSTGRYTLTDVRCKGCSTRLGWRYIEAASLVRFHHPMIVTFFCGIAAAWLIVRWSGGHESHMAYIALHAHLINQHFC